MISRLVLARLAAGERASGRAGERASSEQTSRRVDEKTRDEQ